MFYIDEGLLLYEFSSSNENEEVIYEEYEIFKLSDSRLSLKDDSNNGTQNITTTLDAVLYYDDNNKRVLDGKGTIRHVDVDDPEMWVAFEVVYLGTETEDPYGEEEEVSNLITINDAFMISRLDEEGGAIDRTTTYHPSAATIYSYIIIGQLVLPINLSYYWYYEGEEFGYYTMVVDEAVPYWMYYEKGETDWLLGNYQVDIYQNDDMMPSVSLKFTVGE